PEHPELRMRTGEGSGGAPGLAPCGELRGGGIRLPGRSTWRGVHAASVGLRRPPDEGRSDSGRPAPPARSGRGPTAQAPEVADLLAAGPRDSRGERQVDPTARGLAADLAAADPVLGDDLGNVPEEGPSDLAPGGAGHAVADTDHEERPRAQCPIPTP